jgi:quercetin dioxygenase-like cupin family protein
MRYVIQEKEGIPVELTGRRMIRLVTPEIVGAAHLSVVVDYVHPHAAVLPCHSHEAEEAVYVLQGRGEYWIDGNRGVFAPGDVIWFAKGCKHMIRNSTGETMKILCIFSPPMSPDQYTSYGTVAFEKP